MTGVLRPSHPGIQARNAPPQRVLGLVEKSQLVFLGQFVLDVPVGIQNLNGFARLRISVPPHGHPVTDVVGEELQPVVKAPLVQQTGFPVGNRSTSRMTSSRMPGSDSYSGQLRTL